jgi:hypothetical protein
VTGRDTAQVPPNSQTAARALTDRERALILALVPQHESTLSTKTLEDALVVDMRDGGMGSIRFIKEGNRRRSRSIAHAEYVDEDGIAVSIEVTVGEDNELFEIDIWKMDFSPLRRYPHPEDLER